MTAPAEPAWLAADPYPAPPGGGPHWEDCERVHPGCAYRLGRQSVPHPQETPVPSPTPKATFPPNMQRYVAEAVIRVALDRHPHLPMVAALTGNPPHAHGNQGYRRRTDCGARGVIHLYATLTGIKVSGTGWPTHPGGSERRVCNPPILIPYPPGPAAEILSATYRAAVDQVIDTVANLIRRTRDEHDTAAAGDEAAERAALAGACADEAAYL
ncbi:hypothetical protein ABT352_32830 [Streptosporangium sp. NPDC000563]|uniref:hypothetical protein n=1 Tax=Streptosporangium sp. NPDC000563 TaxID=3154366 RepID=UPI003325AD9B